MEKVVLVQEEMTVKQKLQDILMVLSWREMARSYFGKSSVQRCRKRAVARGFG